MFETWKVKNEAFLKESYARELHEATNENDFELTPAYRTGRSVRTFEDFCRLNYETLLEDMIDNLDEKLDEIFELEK